MSKFTIEIDCGNAAFDDSVCIEISRILRDLAKKMEWDENANRNYMLRDSNGNNVGIATLEVK
jgi:hypothetical protein